MTPRESGRRDGYCDRHVTRRNFATGDEWRSWLAGWREGQAQLSAERARKPAKKPPDASALRAARERWKRTELVRKPQGRRAG